MSSDAFKRKLDAVGALRTASEAQLLTGLAKALQDRSNFIVAKAAALASERSVLESVPQLLAAYDRFFDPDLKTDPLALAKHAIAKSLAELDYRDPVPFVRGLHHVQREPAFGGSVDVAGGLRGTCALALVRCDIDDLAVLRELVDHLITDSAKDVRINVVRAIAQTGGAAGVVLLRAKVLAGDADAEVVGECFAALLTREPHESVSFVERYVDRRDPELQFEALCALAGARDPAAHERVERLWPSDLPLDVRRAVIFSCAASPAREAAEFLLRVVGDARPELGAWALQALAASRWRDEYAERACRAAQPMHGAAYVAAFAGTPRASR